MLDYILKGNVGDVGTRMQVETHSIESFSVGGPDNVAVAGLLISYIVLVAVLGDALQLCCWNTSAFYNSHGLIA